MDTTPRTDSEQEALTLADVYADLGQNPDRTGDYAAGRTRVFLSGEEFLAYLDSRRSRPS